jgi:hypothetical protein
MASSAKRMPGGRHWRGGWKKMVEEEWVKEEAEGLGIRRGVKVEEK